MILLRTLGWSLGDPASPVLLEGTCRGPQLKVKTRLVHRLSIE